MTGYRHKMLNKLAIYLLYMSQWTNFTSDAANSADSYSTVFRIPFSWPTALSSKGTREGKEPLGSGRPSFALFSKYLNNNIFCIHD